MAPFIAGCFGAIIFGLIKYIVHKRRSPSRWAVVTSPFFFLIAGTICTLSIVYKGSPNLKLNARPPWFIASVTMGTGAGLALLAAIFFVPFLYTKIIKREAIPWYMVFYGPALWARPAPQNADRAVVPNYAVVQEDGDDHGSAETAVASASDISEHEKDLVVTEVNRPTTPLTHAQIQAQGLERLHAKLRKGKGPLGWAMRQLHDKKFGPGAIYELHNIKILFQRIPAYIVCGALYG